MRRDLAVFAVVAGAAVTGATAFGTVSLWIANTPNSVVVTVDSMFPSTATVGLSGSGPAGALDPQSATATETSIAMSSVDYAMKVRSSYGLRFDRPYVESVESDPTASRELGIALTADEVNEVKASQTPVLLVLEPLTRELEADPTFGGIYLDRAAGGVLDIATTADVSHFAPILTRFASNDVRFRVRHVSYTLAELKSLQDRVTSDFASWQGQGIQIAVVGVDVVNNRLAITVVALTPTAKASIEAAYGQRVAVSAGEAFHF